MREHEALQKLRDRRLIQDEGSDILNAADPGKAFYAKYREWVDWQNELFEKHGLWTDGTASHANVEPYEAKGAV
jgi:hypothetical protein